MLKPQQLLCLKMVIVYFKKFGDYIICLQDFARILLVFHGLHSLHRFRLDDFFLLRPQHLFCLKTIIIYFGSLEILSFVFKVLFILHGLSSLHRFQPDDFFFYRENFERAYSEVLWVQGFQLNDFFSSTVRISNE